MRAVKGGQWRWVVPNAKLVFARPARLALKAAAISTAPNQPDTSVYNKIKDVNFVRASTGEAVSLANLWGPTDRVVVSFARHLG